LNKNHLHREKKNAADVNKARAEGKGRRKFRSQSSTWGTPYREEKEKDLEYESTGGAAACCGGQPPVKGKGGLCSVLLKQTTEGIEGKKRENAGKSGEEEGTNKVKKRGEALIRDRGEWKTNFALVRHFRS